MTFCIFHTYFYIKVYNWNFHLQLRIPTWRENLPIWTPSDMWWSDIDRHIVHPSPPHCECYRRFIVLVDIITTKLNGWSYPLLTNCNLYNETIFFCDWIADTVPLEKLMLRETKKKRGKLTTAYWIMVVCGGFLIQCHLTTSQVYRSCIFLFQNKILLTVY